MHRPERPPRPFPMPEIVLQLVGNGSNGDVDPFGSAVLIAPGVALTAAHVIEDYSRKFDRRLPEDGVPFDFNVLALQRKEGSHLLWRTAHVLLARFTDAALLLLEPHGPPTGGEPIRYATPIELRPPRIGDKVLAVGFHGPIARVTDGKALELKSEAGQWMGEVQEIHMRGRDKMLPHPCFHATVRIEGGMSGGPVLNTAGRLCGLVCSGAKASELDPVDTAHFTMLWPLMGLPLRGRFADFFGVQADARLLDVAHRGGLLVHGHEFVTRERKGTDGLPVRWRGPQR